MTKQERNKNEEDHVSNSAFQIWNQNQSTVWFPRHFQNLKQQVHETTSLCHAEARNGKRYWKLIFSMFWKIKSKPWSSQNCKNGKFGFKKVTAWKSFEKAKVILYVQTCGRIFKNNTVNNITIITLQNPILNDKWNPHQRSYNGSKAELWFHIAPIYTFTLLNFRFFPDVILEKDGFWKPLDPLQELGSLVEETLSAPLLMGLRRDFFG